MAVSSGYQTKQRALIEEIFARKGDHVTVDSLTAELGASKQNVGRTTVYRCLERLVEEGRARKYVAAKGESACYQYVDNKEGCTEHFHLKCENCGRLFHIECEHISKLSNHIKRSHNFKVNNLKTVLYGVCEECGAK